MFRGELELFTITQNQIIDLNAHSIALRHALNRLAETDPRVAKAMDEYENVYQSELHEAMLRVEARAGSEFAAHFDKFR